jgi:hypothetical protein
MELRVQIASFHVAAISTPDGMSLALSDLGPAPPPGKTIYQRLSDEVGTSAGPGSGGAKSPRANDIPDDSKPTATAFDRLTSGVMLWYVQIGLDGLCHEDKRRNNPGFSQFSCIDENLRLKRKENNSVPCQIFMYSSAWPKFA